MKGKHFYAGRMVEFSVLFKVDLDFPDVLGFYILLQAPGEHPANNLAPIILRKVRRAWKYSPWRREFAAFSPEKWRDKGRGCRQISLFWVTGVSPGEIK